MDKAGTSKIGSTGPLITKNHAIRVAGKIYMQKKRQNTVHRYYILLLIQFLKILQNRRLQERVAPLKVMIQQKMRNSINNKYRS